MRIIWIDDDSFGILSVLERRFRRNRFSVERFKCYEDAEDFINQNLRATDALLIDLILPSKEVKVSAFLGLGIAEIALKNKVKNITFLSVVNEAEVKDDLEKLKNEYKEFNYKCFNKAKLVEADTFDKLIKTLQKRADE